MTSLPAPPAEPDEPGAARVNNRETVESYERCARDYAAATAPEAAGAGNPMLQRFIKELAPGGTVLEIGSGPGWDADVLEASGAVVRRTDITASFLALQRERGKHAERLDVIADALDGPYDGVVALYVLQHIDRSLIDAVLHKVAAALRPAGLFLVALREGTGQTREYGRAGDVYHITCWPRAAFTQHMDVVGLETVWGVTSTDADGDWMTLLARKRA